jgi:hypothetical protein
VESPLRRDGMAAAPNPSASLHARVRLEETSPTLLAPTTRLEPEHQLHRPNKHGRAQFGVRVERIAWQHLAVLRHIPRWSRQRCRSPGCWCC